MIIYEPEVMSAMAAKTCTQLNSGISTQIQGSEPHLPLSLETPARKLVARVQ